MRDIENNKCVIVRRFDGEKKVVEQEGLAEFILAEFKDISEKMYASAEQKINEKKKTASNWTEFMEHLNNKNMILTAWCDEDECEKSVKNKSGMESKANDSEGDSGMTGKAKTLCKPLDQEKVKEGEKCFSCGKDAKCYVYWGRSY